MVNVKNKHYTQEQISDANMVDLTLFLQRQGEKLIKAGREYRLGSNHSVTVYKNKWYDHAEGKGGHSIDFVMWLYHYSFPQAIDIFLSANHVKAITDLEREQNSVVLKKFELPTRNSNNKRVFAYLQKTRKIDAEIINHCIKKQILYEESVHHNCVFVGNDMSGTARYAMMRGTLAYGDRQYKRELFGSKKQYGFRFGNQAANKIYIFESPIDAMSYASLRKNSGENWRDSNYLSLGGVSEKALEYFLKIIQRR